MKSARLGRIVLVVGGALFLIAAYTALTYLQVRGVASTDEAGPADAIVVLGAAQYNGRPSPVFRARLDHALKLFEEGHANVIVTTRVRPLAGQVVENKSHRQCRRRPGQR